MRILSIEGSLTDSGHLLLIKELGHVVLVGDVVVEVEAPGLHGAHVELHQALERSAGLLHILRPLAEETFPEQAAGPREEQWALVHQSLQLRLGLVPASRQNRSFPLKERTLLIIL